MVDSAINVAAGLATLIAVQLVVCLNHVGGAPYRLS
jgi:hypothetical protein